MTNSEEVESLLKQHPTRAVPVEDNNHNWLITHHLSSVMSLGEQCDAVSLLPNHSHLSTVRRFLQRFSVTSKCSLMVINPGKNNSLLPSIICIVI